MTNEFKTEADITAYMLSTSDNEFNPFTEFDRWLDYDLFMGYDTCGCLNRECPASEELSPFFDIYERNQAIMRMIANDFIALETDGLVHYIRVKAEE